MNALLVYQTTTDGKLLYADTFWPRDGAERAAKAANERKKWWGSRQSADVVRLPWDMR